ncbi:helix-turn-helix domain-containing protein [Bradyrhizobium cenepequi]|uniref:helix-turn-helix domain-containing protein n=1 Tax=Bradyrhizobium cenepequi TaxID=2821403 RepID=UPI001CE32B57|nr:helix-turn-helix domain-containing protein [Bradyrhizobium cenepequi]
MVDSWQYWCPPAGSAVELGLVCGLSVALPVHFHPEDQITLVMSGKRRFVIHDELIEVVAGESLTIPAGTVHRSLSDSADVCCINIYVPPEKYDERDLLAQLPLLLRSRDGRTQLNGAVTLNGLHRTVAKGARPGAPGAIHISQWETVSQAADRAGMTREGFSRRFKKLQGLPPEDFRLLSRLNDARRLLRTGEPIAMVAAEAGFSDQSHLSRCFRRFFGVTPGRYRGGVGGRSVADQ